MIRVILLVVLLTAGIQGEGFDRFDALTASQIAGTVGVALDIASSPWGGGYERGWWETNPLYASHDGSFGVRGAALRGGMWAGVVIAQRLLARRHPHHPAVKVFVAINFTVASAGTYAAGRNWSMAR